MLQVLFFYSTHLSGFLARLMMTPFISLYTGCVTAAKESHLNGCDRQRHLWSLLASRLNAPRCRQQPQPCCIFCYWHHDHAYALINPRFRERIKKMICCRSSSVSPLVHATREPQDIEMANNTTQPSDTGEPTATKKCVREKFLSDFDYPSSGNRLFSKMAFKMTLENFQIIIFQTLVWPGFTLCPKSHKRLSV